MFNCNEYENDLDCCPDKKTCCFSCERVYECGSSCSYTYIFENGGECQYAEEKLKGESEND